MTIVWLQHTLKKHSRIWQLTTGSFLLHSILYIIQHWNTMSDCYQNLHAYTVNKLGVVFLSIKVSNNNFTM